MTTEEAIEVAEAWFAHIERRKQDSITPQRAAGLARKGEHREARRLKSQVDSAPRVFDGARLEPAVRVLVEWARDSRR